MGRKKKNLVETIKDIIKPQLEEVIDDIEKDLTLEEYLSNPEALEELTNGKGEDDELLEPEAEGEVNGN